MKLRFYRRPLQYGIIFFMAITLDFYCFGVQATAQTSGQSGSPDPVVIKAKKEIIRINKLVDTLKKGDQKTARQYFDQLKQLEPGLKAVKNIPSGRKRPHVMWPCKNALLIPPMPNPIITGFPDGFLIY